MIWRSKYDVKLTAVYRMKHEIYSLRRHIDCGKESDISVIILRVIFHKALLTIKTSKKQETKDDHQKRLWKSLTRNERNRKKHYNED